MKVVAFNGSARKDGNTALLIGHVFAELEAAGIETELVQLAGKRFAGCTGLPEVRRDEGRPLLGAQGRRPQRLHREDARRRRHRHRLADLLRQLHGDDAGA